MQVFCTIIVLLIFIFHVKVLPATVSKNNIRTIRETEELKCDVPSIPHGNIKILKQKKSSKKHILSLNVTCDYNYFLEPSSDNLMSCINGFWDIDDIPECKACKGSNIARKSQSCREAYIENSTFTECGQRFDETHRPFIVNGTISKFAEFPWHVGIYKKDACDAQPLYNCGGSIISVKSVLTVAHCLSHSLNGDLFPSREYYVAAGKHFSNYFSDARTAQKRKVDHIFLHPQYGAELTSYAWDIAVARIEGSFEFSPLVHPVCIDWWTNFEDEHLAPNKYGEVAGWGKTEKEINSAASQLRVVRVPFINPQTCNNVMAKSFIRYITPDKFCAGYTNGSSVCDGDSGGGLVFVKDEKYYIRGLVSVGAQSQGRCDEFKYSVYTKVSNYILFLINCIENEKTVYDIPPQQTHYLPPVTTEGTPCTTPNNDTAACVPYNDCGHFITALKENPTQEVIRFINESYCVGNNKTEVCCGRHINYLSAMKKNPIIGVVIFNKNIILLPSREECGRTISNRQKQGKVFTKFYDYPWMALLEYGSQAQSAGFLCVGSLINKRYIMTSARCALKRRSADIGQVFRVRLGEYDISSKKDCVNSTRKSGRKVTNCADPPLNVNVEEIIPHPLYDSRKKINDIALLRLSEDVLYTDYIKPICLPTQREYSLPGKQMSIVNWDINALDITYPVKNETIVNVTEYEKCEKKYKEIGIQLSDSHICAARKDIVKDECSVDIGSPLMTTLANSKSIYAEGVISFSSGSCGEFPIVTTNVARYMEWILDNLKE